MRQAVILAVVGALSVAGALGRDLPDDVVREPHRAAGEDAALPDRYGQTRAVKEVWVTADNQILVELALDEATRPNLFDLNERTLVFTPDGTGRYSHEARALEWEEEIGEEVEYAIGAGAVIMLESFDFPFAGQRWDSLHLGSPGVMTFGEPFTYSFSKFDITMLEIADEFISSPTISALYKPWRYGTQHVARRTDRIVVTWLSWEERSWVHGVRPEKPARFQTVLGADGSIQFNYVDVPYEDGIVGLFQGGVSPLGVDLSQSDSPDSNRHHEVFHFRSVFNRAEVICHLLGVLGDAFDLFVFHSENREDYQGVTTTWGGRGITGMQAAAKDASKVFGHIPSGFSPDPCSRRLPSRKTMTGSIPACGCSPMNSPTPGSPTFRTTSPDNANRYSSHPPKAAAIATGGGNFTRLLPFHGTGKLSAPVLSWEGASGSITGRAGSRETATIPAAVSPGSTSTPWDWPMPRKCPTCLL